MKLNFSTGFCRKSLKTSVLFFLVPFLFYQFQPAVFAANPLISPDQAPYMPVTELENSSPTRVSGGSSAQGGDATSGFLGGSPLSNPSLNPPAEGEGGSTTIFPLPPASPRPITRLPKNSSGRKVPLTSFVSYDPSQQDWSNMTVSQTVPDFTQINMNLYNTTSYAGIAADFDDPTTAGAESISFIQLYPTGVVFGLSNGGSNITEIYFGVQDTQGNVDWVTLGGLESVEHLWAVDLASFTGVDLAHVQNVFFEVDGRHVDGQVNLHWGDVEYTPDVISRPNNPQQATKLPALSTGQQPVLQTYVSYDPNNPDPALRDWSNTKLSLFSPESAQMDFNLYNTFSQAALYIDYEDYSTPAAESINFNALFPSGLVFGLDNGGSGNIDDLYFRITDVNGFDDWVKLNGVSEARKYYKLELGLFDEADLSHIQTLEFWVLGRHTDGRLNVTWGNYDYTPQAFLVQGTEYQESALSEIIAAPQIIVQGGGNTAGSLPGQISYEVLRPQEIECQYNLWNGDQNYVSLDLKSADAAAGGAPMNLPSQLVIAARGGENAETRMVLTDILGHEAIFQLDLNAGYQNYLIPLVGAHMPQGFDRTQVVQIRFYQDRSFGNPQNWSNIFRVQIKGLSLQPGYVPPDLRVFQTQMVQDSLKYFQNPAAIDPVTHLPYDRSRADGVVEPAHQIVQPTLAGFYLQMLSDFIRGKMDWPGMTKSQAMDRLDAALDGLFNIQSTYGWKGLIPWMDQGVPYPVAGIGDNANLAQSMAVMIGALEMAQLSASERTRASSIAARAEHFLDLQAPGYTAAVDSSNGLFAGAIYRSTGAAVYHIDRLVTEFRGAIAFLLIRYPQLPRSVWDNLVVQKDADYIDRNGNRITNLQSYEGGAFQYFWPLLRNNERDFIGMRNALESYFNTQTDYAAANQIPGFLSASDMPGHAYNGLIGIPQIAETEAPLTVDLGSTYALASAYSVNQYQVLNWLKKIHDANPALYGRYGFLDSSRSNTEVAQFYLGIDVASTILALNNAGPEAFENYLRNRNEERAYNILYDKRTQFGLERTVTRAADAPNFPDRSYSVFSHVAVDGTLGNFPYIPTTPEGVRLAYNGFGTSFDGRYWELNDTYNAQGNLFDMYYSIKDSPGKIRIEFKDDTPQENLIYAATVTLPASAVNYQKLEIRLPDEAAFSKVRKVFVIIDQSTGDTRGDFTIHALNFKHFGAVTSAPASPQNLGAINIPAPDRTRFASSPNNSGGISVQGDRYIVDTGSMLSWSASASFDYDHPVDLRGKTQLVLGLSGELFAVSNLVVQPLTISVTDSSGKTQSVGIFGVNLDERVWYIPFSLFPEIDWGNVVSIGFGTSGYNISGTHWTVRVR